MPVEFALFAPGPISVEEQRGIAEVMNPPLVATQTRDGGTLEFTEFDGTPVITLGRARVVETQADLRRVFRHEVEVPDDTTCWYEGAGPQGSIERGLAVLFGLAELSGGTPVVKGTQL